MNLHALAAARAAEGRPVRVALIGAGKFGSMVLAQVPTSPLHVAGIADLDPGRARATAYATGWDAAGRPMFDPRVLCHSPQERLFYKGEWHPGLVPADAVVERAGRKSVLVVEGGLVRAQPVEVKSDAGGGMLELADGPPVGTPIVRHPPPDLLDGAKVKKSP